MIFFYANSEGVIEQHIHRKHFNTWFSSALPLVSKGSTKSNFLIYLTDNQLLNSIY